MSPEQLSLFGAPAAPAPKKQAGEKTAGKIVAPSVASAAPADPLSLPEPPKDRPQERMAWLTTILEHHNYLYHTLDKPVISDDQYDATEAVSVANKLVYQDGVKAVFRPSEKLELKAWFDARDAAAAGAEVELKKAAEKKGYVEKSNTFTPEEARYVNGNIVILKTNDK